jgi:hypothetical protein
MGKRTIQTRWRPTGCEVPVFLCELGFLFFSPIEEQAIYVRAYMTKNEGASCKKGTAWGRLPTYSPLSVWNSLVFGFAVFLSQYCLEKHKLHNERPPFLLSPLSDSLFLCLSVSLINVDTT